MSWVRASGAAVVLLLMRGPVSGQTAPDLPLQTYPDVARRAIAEASADARARPDDPARQGHLGMVLQAWQQWDAASAAYARARTLERRFDWSYLGGVVATRAARHTAAADLFRDAVALSPGSTPARLRLADALYESGGLDQAEREYTTALSDPHAEPHGHYGLGRILAARGQQAAAIAQFDEAIRLYREFGAAWYARGLAERNLGELDKAQESLARAQQFGARWPGVEDPVLDRVNALRRDPAARMDRGLQLERQDDIDGAIREHEAALIENAAFAQAHVNLIRLYGRKGEWSRSEAHYKEAMRLGADAVDANYSYGVTLLLQGRDADAQAAFERVLSINPRQGSAWNGLGQIAERAGRLDDALAHYRKAHECTPADRTVRFNVARLLIATRQLRDAIAEFEILAADASPEQPRYVFGLATAWVLSGEVDKGRKIALDARALAAARGQTDLVAAIDRDLARLPREGKR